MAVGSGLHWRYHGHGGGGIRKDATVEKLPNIIENAKFAYRYIAFFLE